MLMSRLRLIYNITALVSLIPQLLCFDVIENSPLKTLDLIIFFFQYKLTVPKMGNISDLLDVLSKLSRIPKDKVLYSMHKFSSLCSKILQIELQITLCTIGSARRA